MGEAYLEQLLDLACMIFFAVAVLIVLAVYASGHRPQRPWPKRRILTTQQWANVILEKAQAANWPNIGELYDLMDECLKNPKGHLIYIALADQDGNSDDIDVKVYPPESVIGYHTDGKTFAIAFTYPDGMDRPEWAYRTDCPQVGIPALAKKPRKWGFRGR